MLFDLKASATIINVNNSVTLPVNPGQYTTIQAAIDAASSGDTILVAGSAIQYNGATITKSITLIGAGYNPDKQNNYGSIIYNGSMNLQGAGNNNTKIIGFEFRTDIYIDLGANSVQIKRCFFTGTHIIIKDSTTNTLITENIFRGGYVSFASTSTVKSKGQKNLTISNNVFSDGACIKYTNLYWDGSKYVDFIKNDYSPVYIIHNLFLDGSYNNPLPTSNFKLALVNLRNAVIENNIFYNIDPSIDANSCTTCGVNNTYNNNLTYAGASLPSLPIANNIGNGNINNSDPKFTAIFSSSTVYWIISDNFRLKNSSPGKNAGTDASDIGPTGGSFPIYLSTNRWLTGEPPIPQIKSMNIIGPAATTPGGAIKISVQAIKIN